MVNEGKELSNADYQQLFNVSKNTAPRDLRSLAACRREPILPKNAPLKHFFGLNLGFTPHFCLENAWI